MIPAERETILRYDETSTAVDCYTASPAVAHRWQRLGWPVMLNGRAWCASVPLDVLQYQCLKKGAKCPEVPFLVKELREAERLRADAQARHEAALAAEAAADEAVNPGPSPTVNGRNWQTCSECGTALTDGRPSGRGLALCPPCRASRRRVQMRQAQRRWRQVRRNQVPLERSKIPGPVLT